MKIYGVLKIFFVNVQTYSKSVIRIRFFILRGERGCLRIEKIQIFENKVTRIIVNAPRFILYKTKFSTKAFKFEKFHIP